MQKYTCIQTLKVTIPHPSLLWPLQTAPTLGLSSAVSTAPAQVALHIHLHLGRRVARVKEW